jgi:predicted transcriptional regulator
MTVHRTVDLDDRQYEKLNLVAGAYRLSVAELIRAALTATLNTIAAEDKLLGAGMKFIDSGEPPVMPKRVSLD